MEIVSQSLPFIALYAATHFRLFRFVPSLLYKRMPEILFDIPRRLGPGLDLPILLICNDIDRFPVHIMSVELAISGNHHKNRLHVFKNIATSQIKHPMSGQSISCLFRIPRMELEDGLNHVTAKATIYNTKTRKEIVVLNDNIFSSSKQGFTTFVTDQPLPCSSRCSYGDCHVHTQFSQSHVEFGAPMQVTADMAHAIGLDFLAITDHSYDLACSMTNYLKQDAKIPRWQIMKDEIALHSKSTTLVCGEEISCKNGRGRFVHLCAIGTTEYIPGTGDGARRNTTRLPQFSIGEVVDRIHKQNGLAIAAHPGARSGYLQRILLGRGKWNNADASQPLDALQASNGNFGKSWIRAKKLWLTQLAAGKKLAIVAGNDTHGDFNRYRCIDIPLATIRENFGQYLGTVKTGLYGTITGSSSVVDLIAAGKTFVTNGPYCSITTEDPLEVVVGTAGYKRSEGKLLIQAESTAEFGSIQRISVFGLRYGGSKFEEQLMQVLFSDEKEFKKSLEIPLEKIPESGYIRAELITKLPDTSLAIAFTSPCYIT